MAAAGVPTAHGPRVHHARARSAAALDAFGPPYVVKDDGLAAGKGVVVTDDRDAALAHAAAVRPGGDRGVPRRPRGLAVRDHRRLDGLPAPAGPGLQAHLRRRRGARTPAAWAPTRRCRGRRTSLVAEVLERVLQPTVDEMARRGTPFAGLLYAGLALTSRGVRVVEFNARFGDPETQPLMALLDSPLGRAARGRGRRPPARGRPAALEAGAAVAVVMASAGYPESLQQGRRHHRHRDAGATEADVDVIHAGTAARDGALVPPVAGCSP